MSNQINNNIDKRKTFFISMINREDKGYTEFLFYIPQDFFLTWDKFCLIVDKDTTIDKTKVKNARKLKSVYLRRMIEKYVSAREYLLK